MKPKKILFYTDTPLLGGAENQMHLLAKFLPKEKYTVELACSSCRGLNALCQKFMEIGVNVRRLRVIHKHDPRHFLYLRHLLPKFDLLHLHLWNPASCRYALAASRPSRSEDERSSSLTRPDVRRGATLKIPVIVTEHDPFPLKGLKAWFKKKLMEHVKAIIVCSQAAKKSVCEGNAECELKTIVIPNGIDIEEFTAQAKNAEKMEIRHAILGNELNQTIILCVAELHERKGQRYLIKAMRRLLPKFPALKLAFAGEGGRRKYYEKLARPLGRSAAFLGRRRDIASIMAAADMLVLPSVREAFGLVLLEAAAVELPMIATNVGGIPEIIEHGKTGMLVPPANPQEIAKAIEGYLEKPELAAELAGMARKRVEKEFHAQQMAMRTVEVYDRVLMSNGKSQMAKPYVKC